jgi:hypothetical protein
VRLLQSHLSLSDGGLHAVSAALVALAVWTVLYGVKAPYLDLDPLNVYFWLFAGIALRLPSLAAPSEQRV